MSRPRKQLGKRLRRSQFSTMKAPADKILTLNEKYSVTRANPEGIYKLIQVNLDMRPDDLSQNFNILLSEHIRIEPDPAQPHQAIICAVSNTDSDLQAAFSIFPGSPGCKIIRSVLDNKLSRLAIVRLSLNVFALRVVKPLLDQLLVKQTPEQCNPTTLHDCVTLRADQFELEKSGERIIVRVTETVLCWHQIEGGIAGPRGLTSRIALHAPDLDLPHPIFSRLTSSTCPLTVSTLSQCADGTLKFNVTTSQEDFETTKAVSFEIQLFQEVVQRPYFSGTPSPYFTPNGDDCLDVRLPYDLHIKQSFTLRLYRRFYGPYLGLFVPKPNLGVEMPVTVWLPKTWLEITLVGRRASLRRDDIIGQLYFIASDYVTNRGRSSAFSHQVRSSLHLRSDHSCLSVLGTSIRLDDLLSLSVRPREDTTATTETSPDAKTTLAMVLQST
ncbi:protein UL84 [Aotine betaherpesvirus 1]|uniref:Protein UL84 n=1 Tax=Aotine betaherpesvirus 1 TaxID=50290 RepID=G8XUF0_9BETA|nr:protein UL84 [Aotine betaherpesvirus 1]AEV80780.1 protein UL84 [Aotine betaherpesvirus 1]